MRILHTMIRVGNLERAIAFYTEVLGMRLLRRKDYPGGRFTLSLTQPLASGDHTIQVAVEGGEYLVRVGVSPAPPLTGGPLRAERLERGWRADWMTPGGGVQTTVLFGPGARS